MTGRRESDACPGLAVQALGWLQDCAARAGPEDDPATLARILARTPLGPVPSRWTCLARLPRHRLAETRAGPAWRLSGRFEFCSEPVPVQIIWLGRGAWAATLHASAWPALAGAFARHALAGICRARGWRFPQDFATPERARLLWELPWAGEPPLELDPASQARLGFGSGQGSLSLAGRWHVNARRGRLRLLWSDETLLILEAEMDDPTGMIPACSGKAPYPPA
ncbi:MAG: hypothetical protein AB1899_07960 [Pseudomonadota bacterium]